MANKLSYTISILLLLTFAGNTILAQCCGAGNPVSGFGNVSGIPYKTLLVGSNYKYSYSDQYYSGSEKVDISPDKSYYNFLGLNMAYGITNRLSVRGDLGYFLSKTKIYNIEGWDHMKGYGLGDAELSIRYVVIKRVLKKFDIIPGIGVKLPVGVFDQVVDDVKLPISLQPSSGSLKYNINIFVFKGINKHSVSFRAFAEFANPIQSQNFNYKYGNLYIFSAYGSFVVSKKINLLSQLRYEYRRKSMRENKQIVASSGGKVLFFIPQINVMPSESLGISLYANIPLYKYMNGIQLSNKYAISIKVYKSFNFNKNCKPQNI